MSVGRAIALCALLLAPLPATPAHAADADYGNAGTYISSAFDVAHDQGLRTAMFASKNKFALYPDSYPDKIDASSINTSTPDLVAGYISAMTASPFHYSFLHFHDTDSAGHGYGWNTTDSSSQYMTAVRAVDGYLGTLLDMIDTDERFDGRTAIVLTADHGGQTGGHDHSVATDPDDFNAATRANPLLARPGYDQPSQPIRNGDAANLALRLLGLGAVPGSTIGAEQDLAVQIPEPTAAGAMVVLTTLATVRRRVRGSVRVSARRPPRPTRR